MVDVFISYAREDRKIATKLAHALEDRGYSVWWDPVIPPGKMWAEAIGTQLRAASCVVTLWSAVSVTKRWVRKEATFADEQNKLIPAKLEDVTIPFAVADIQAADLTGWEGDTSHEGFQHLVFAISELLRNPPSKQTEEDIVASEGVKPVAKPETRKALGLFFYGAVGSFLPDVVLFWSKRFTAPLLTFDVLQYSICTIVYALFAGLVALIFPYRRQPPREWNALVVGIASPIIVAAVIAAGDRLLLSRDVDLTIRGGDLVQGPQDQQKKTQGGLIDLLALY
jgi:TIR domain